jgi:hypothetical protein
MSRVYGEPAGVQARQDGRPEWFAWRGRHYTVTSVIGRWVVNREWWREPAPAPARPELEFWRVEASAKPRSAGGHSLTGTCGQAGAYELCRAVAAGTWTLRRVED